MSTTSAKQKEALLSARQIEGLLANGRKIIILDQKVLKVDPWLKYHPGGDKAILHMVGKDATDEINAYHSKETKQSMFRYQIGRIEGRWKNFESPIAGGVFRPYIEGQADREAAEETSTPSGSEDSRAPSPLFDTDLPALHQRRQNSGRSTSVSSVSSEEDETNEYAFLDARTKELRNIDLQKYPSLDPTTQGEIVNEYRKLEEQIRAEGLFECNYFAYAIEACRYALFVVMAILCNQWGWYGFSGVFLGCLWHQLSFTVHDAGHMGISHNFTVDTTIGILIADFIGGLSLGWWKRSHNVHHIVTNHPEHDPDNQHLPFFAITEEFLKSLTSTYHERVMPFDSFAKFMVRYQAFLYYPIMTLGRFNLYVQSWIFLVKGQGPQKGPAAWTRWVEIIGQVFFWTWYGYGVVYSNIPNAWGRFTFVMMSNMVTMPLHVQITLSHFAMSTADLGPEESFPQKMLRTTMDVDCPQWLDFFHGGLQFQAIHHLYPRIPRHNLRATQKLVQEFCNNVGIPYALYGFVDGNKKVIGRLGDVATQAAILAKCQQSMIEKGEMFGDH